VNVLGLNSYFEHPAVALVCDGELVFAAEDERFTRVKHGRRYTPYGVYLPVAAMHAALEWAGLTTADLDEIAYSYNRWDHLRGMAGCLTGRRVSSLRDELAGFASLTNLRQAFEYAVPFSYRDSMPPEGLAGVRFQAWNHHLAHAGSAFFCSGFDEALVVVADGAGERACTSVYRGRGARLELIGEEPIPNSLGLFYSFVTRHIGFEPFADEYKVMGLAAHGEPSFEGSLGTVLTLRPEGRYAVDMDRLRKLDALLGPPRRPGEEIGQVHMDVARSAQALLERALGHVVGHHVRSTGARQLCLAGGTFLNCVANGRLAEDQPLDAIFVQPAAHDAGTAVGAAALSTVRAGGGPQVAYDSMALGTSYDDELIADALADAGIAAERLADAALVERMAERLTRNRVCAVFRGRMEFGPRALGRRSVLANPADPKMQERLNRVKGREQFRPVAPAITKGAFGEYFEGEPNRFMMFAARARERARREVPAAVHVDGSARPQAVCAEEDPFFHALLEEFASRSGFPVLINTSFNGMNEPIVETPHAALACFFTKGVDCLALGSYFVEKGVVGD
jgi:carbamoyltransferase